MTAITNQAEVKQFAEELFVHGPDWGTFYREILGFRGIVRHLFPTREERAAFEQGEIYQEILLMLTHLRRQPAAETESHEPTRVITVRMPKSLHESLRAEAHEHHTSMNKLCISKLVQVIDGEHVPADEES